MHIHPNNSLILASLGSAREEAQEIQAKRAAEVRRKLSTAARVMEDSEETSGLARVQARSYYEAEPRQGDDDGFGRLFSADA